jgi:transcriptional regulator with XRE-family HTH domain
MAKGLEVKGFGPFEIKDESRGEVRAVVASMDTPDRDGDVLLSGALRPGNRVKLSGWGHDVVLANAPPVGVGTMVEEDGKAVFEGRFFLSSQRGADAFATVKELGEDGEWSYGFRRAEAKTADLTEEWRERGATRLYSEINPIEASPVFLPAGFGTQTLSVKAEGSLTQRMDAVNAALMERNEGLDSGDWWWGREVFEDHVIVETDDGLLRVPYTLDDDGAVTLQGTDAAPVEVEYRDVEAESAEEGDAETRGAEDRAFAKALASLKRERGLTYAQIAEVMEVAEEDVPAILSGDRAPPDYSTLKAVAEKLPKPVPAMVAEAQEEEEVAHELKRFERNRQLADALDLERELEAKLAAQRRVVAEMKAERDGDAEFQAKIREELAQFERTRRRVGAL